MAEQDQAIAHLRSKAREFAQAGATHAFNAGASEDGARSPAWVPAAIYSVGGELLFGFAALLEELKHHRPIREIRDYGPRGRSL